MFSTHLPTGRGPWIGRFDPADTTVLGTLIRMWLYAAGLLLMDAVLKLNDEASPITVSSMYGLILNVVKVRARRIPNNRWQAVQTVRWTLVKVLLVGTIGGIVERMPRLSGALVPLVIQNSSVVISAVFLALVFGSSDAVIPAWGLFTIVTVFSSIAVLGWFSNPTFWLVASRKELENLNKRLLHWWMLWVAIGRSKSLPMTN